MASTIPAPALRLSLANGLLSITSAHSILTFDVSSKPTFLTLSASTAQVDKVKDAKSKAVRLIASGLVPRSKAEGQEQEWEPVVASLSEGKVLRMTSADTGEVLYERTTSKKGSSLSIDPDGAVILTDKIGDVYCYPFVDESNIPSSSRLAPAPVSIEAATDPTLNPDAKLLAGHVSNVTTHLVLPRLAKGNASGTASEDEYDGPWLVTADRDEHVRMSRYPDAFVVERYLFGHESFVSAIHSPLSNPSLLLSAGGDPDILIFHHPTGRITHRVPILDIYKRHRLVRSAPREVRGLRKAKAKMAERGESVAPGEEETQAVEQKPPHKMRGLTEEEWASAPEGYILPEGEGLCVGKMDSGNEVVVYFTEGTAALHAFRLPAADETGIEVKTFTLECPVLDFTILPTTTGTRVLLSTDPVWEHRVDGGRALYPGEDRHVEPTALEEEHNAFSVIEFDSAGEMTDVSGQHQDLIDLLQSQSTRLSHSEALSIPAYPNLSLLPRWTGMEDDDAAGPEGGAGTAATMENDIESLTKQNRRRALGKLKAAGVEVAIPRTPEQKMRKHEQNVQKKKRKLEEKKAARQVGMEQPAEDVEMGDLEAEMNEAAR